MKKLLILFTLGGMLITDASSANQVGFSSSENASVKPIEADDNPIDPVSVSTDGKTLIAAIDPQIQTVQSHITVPIPTDGKLRMLKATSSSRPISHPRFLLPTTR